MHGTQTISKIIAISVAALALTSSCHKAPPSGQVVARVNGSEVTASELTAEMMAAQLPEGIDAKKIAPAALQSVIARKIVAAEARRVGLDKTPEYLALSRRADEVLLGQQLLNRWAQDMPIPAAAEIAAEISANPQRYDQHQTVTLNQIIILDKLADVNKLGPLHSMAEVSAYLDNIKVRHAQVRKVIDTAMLPLQAFRQLVAAPSGEPLVEVRADGATISAVVSREPAPIVGDAARTAAITALKQKMVGAKVAQLKSGSTLSYQPGYAPPAPRPSGAR